MPDHAVPACLRTPYSSTPDVRGGTIIAEDVLDLESHRRRLLDPDRYRPQACPHCGRSPEAHDFRHRRLRADPQTSGELIRRYRCRPCHAVWQILPAVIARYLHRSWGVVQSALVAAEVMRPSGAERRVRVPFGTVSRWAWRLLLSAVVLTQALLGAGLRLTVPMSCTRGELVELLAADGAVREVDKLAQLAGWIHRLAPGVRLM